MKLRPGAAALLLALAPGAVCPGAPVVIGRTEYAMGTLLEIELEAPDSVKGMAALDTAFGITARLDSLLSDYRPESEVSQIAAQAPAAVKVSPETFDFLARSLAWSARSEGALNPAVGPLVESWGFHYETPSRPDSNVVAALVLRCDYRRIHLDSQSLCVSVDAGMRIDPGATGKGYALAAIDAAYMRLGVGSFRADFGGQLYCRGKDSLLVPVRHPRSDTTALAWLLVSQGSVATSGDYDRYFEQNGIRYAHIIDPRTGYPVQGRAAVTVFAPDPLDADALSTALFVTGPEKASDLLSQAGAGALFAEWVGDSLHLIILGAWPEAP
jgi:thiamine biosynthesis lipoprotein